MSTFFVIERWCPVRREFVPTGNVRTTHPAAMRLLPLLDKKLPGQTRQVAKYVRADVPKKRCAK